MPKLTLMTGFEAPQKLPSDPSDALFLECCHEWLQDEAQAELLSLSGSYSESSACAEPVLHSETRYYIVG